MTDPTAQAAADAARATRDRTIQAAHDAIWADMVSMRHWMDCPADELTGWHVANCRVALAACRAHLNELERLIAQRDGMPVSDGPDVGERRYG